MAEDNKVVEEVKDKETKKSKVNKYKLIGKKEVPVLSVDGGTMMHLSVGSVIIEDKSRSTDDMIGVNVAGFDGFIEKKFVEAIK